MAYSSLSVIILQPIQVFKLQQHDVSEETTPFWGDQLQCESDYSSADLPVAREKLSLEKLNTRLNAEVLHLCMLPLYPVRMYMPNLLSRFATRNSTYGFKHREREKPYSGRKNAHTLTARPCNRVAIITLPHVHPRSHSRHPTTMPRHGSACICRATAYEDHCRQPLKCTSYTVRTIYQALNHNGTARYIQQAHCHQDEDSVSFCQQ